MVEYYSAHCKSLNRYFLTSKSHSKQHLQPWKFNKYKKTFISPYTYLDEKGLSHESMLLSEKMKKKETEKLLQKLSRNNEQIEIDRKNYLDELRGLNKKSTYEGYEIARQEKIKKLMEAKKDHSALCRYSPNYNAIFASVHAVIFPKSRCYKKSNSVSDLTSPQLDSYNVNYQSDSNFAKCKFSKSVRKTLFDITPEEIYEVTPDPRLMRKRKTKLSKHVKGITFEKAFGRERGNFKTKVRPFVSYTPNYDFVRDDTTKTFVHYGKDSKRELRLKKMGETRKAMCRFSVDSSYAVFNVIEEEKEKCKVKKSTSDLMAEYSKYIDSRK